MTGRVGPRRCCGFLWLALAGMLVFGAMPSVQASDEGALEEEVEGERHDPSLRRQLVVLHSIPKIPSWGIGPYLPVHALQEKKATSFWTVSRVAWVTGGLAVVGLIASFGWRYHSVARLNRRLTQQTAVLRTVLDNMDQGISLFDANLNSAAFNDRFVELLGLPPEPNQVGVPLEKFVWAIAKGREFNSDDVEEYVRKYMDAAKQFKARHFVRHKPDGSTIDIRRNPIPGGGFVTTYTDITERMRIENALRISEQQLSEAQRIGGIGHWRYFPDRHRFECSEAFYQIYGWDPDRMVASYAAITTAVHPEDRERMSALRADAGDRKIAYTCEFRIVRPDGEERVLRGEGRPEFDELGRLVSFFGVNQDITEQKRAEEGLLRERTRAELANRAKSEFLANMSHEIRTPLNAIIGFADIMEQEVFGPVGNIRYGEYVSDIHASAQHLLDLVNDILDISTIEAGEMTLSPVELDVNDLFDECTRFVREQARKAEVTLTAEPSAEQMTVHADHRAVRQILLNLLSNAIKFTPPGGRVSIGATTTEDTFAIIVSDTGIGIPPEELPKVTQPFETGNNNPLTSKKGNPHIRPEGTGLGLAIVRSLAKLHGGDLDIGSRDGEGTTVRVWFPRSRRAAA
ncbi:MAG: PAS domain-containing protein [Alphaproteobacteria bacterium]|nr:PAS domain-containing protein [Alphaproteobacteria bacterium]